MKTQVATVGQRWEEGKVYETSDALGASFIRCGHAEWSDILPTFISEFYAKLDEGAGETCIFEPFCGEFGHLIMTHIRLVHFHKASRKIVCCRPGEEVLFPSAHEYITDWRDPVKDADRVATQRRERFDWTHITKRFPNAKPIKAGNLTPSQELICIHPEKRIPFSRLSSGSKVDVCLGVRERAFCPERNWKHWQLLANELTAKGVSFAVTGATDTAPPLAGQRYHSGHNTALAIELLQKCKLYVGCDAGNSHLAATVGANMLVFREEDGGSRNMIPRMEQVNPGRIAFMPHVWNKPKEVIANVLATLGGI